MIKYDEGNNLLVMKKVNLPEPKGFDHNILSDLIASYRKYSDFEEGTVLKDIEYLFDKIHEKFLHDSTTDVYVQVTSIAQKEYGMATDRYATRRRELLVVGTIYSKNGWGSDNIIARDVVLFKIPYMDSRGVITIDTSNKTLVNSLQASEGVSYSRKDREINIQLGSRNMKFFMEDSGKFSMSTSKKKHQFIDNVIYGCANIEQMDSTAAFRDFEDIHNSAILRSSTIGVDYDPSSGFIAAKDVIKDLYTNEAYKLNAKARHELNKACQLDRAVGETLSKDVVVNGNVLAKRGEVITKNMVAEFKKNLVTRLYIRHIPKLEGLTPRNIPPVTIIAKGTRINNYVRRVLKDNYAQFGYFVTQDIDLNLTAQDLEKGSAATLISTPGILNEGGKLQPEHVEALYNIYIGLESAADALAASGGMSEEERARYDKYLRHVCPYIRVARQHSQVQIPLDVEVLTNKTFWGPDIGKSEEAWFVLSEDGKLMKQTDDTRPFVIKLSDKGTVSVPMFNGTYINRHDIKALYSMIGWYALEPESRILFDRDEMLLKKVKTVDNIFHECFVKAVDKLLTDPRQYSMLRRSINNGKYLTDEEERKKLFRVIQKNFNSILVADKLVQTADMKNPAATLSQVSNITTVVQSSKAVSEDQRLLSFAYASRICPYETPASGRIGLVNHKAVGCRINEEGALTAAYRKIDKNYKNGFHRVQSEVVYMTAAEASKYSIADILSLRYVDEEKGVFTESAVTAMVPNESKRGEAIVVETISSFEVDYVFAVPEATISATAMLIPFLGADDTARISFGLSMQKQAINCLENEKPRVLTSMYKDILDYSNYYAIRASHPGVVVGIDSDYITVKYLHSGHEDPIITDEMYPTERVDALIGRKYKTTGKTIIPKEVAYETGSSVLKAPFPCVVEKLVDVPDRKGYSRLYLAPYIIPDKSLEYNEDLVKEAGLYVGQEVPPSTPLFSLKLLESKGIPFDKQRHMFANPYTIKSITEGKKKNTLRVTLTPPECGSYEEAKIACHTVEISQSDCIFMHYDKGVGDAFEADEILAHASVIKDGIYSPARNAVVCYLPTGYNYEDAIDMSQDCARHYTAVAAHTQDVSSHTGLDFNNVNMGYISEGTNIFTGDIDRKNRAHNVSGYYLNRIYTDRDKTEKGKCVYATVRLLAFNNQHEGDKLAGRHGNKGVQARICPNSEMPMFKNGRIPDICLNPCGVPSRMNIGQNLEAHLGFVATMLDTYIVSDPFNGASRDDIAMMMEYVWRLANETDVSRWRSITEEYGLPISLCNHAITNSDYIHSWKGCFNADGTAQMWDPKSQRYFTNPIAFGVAYFLKLEQEADEKIHARAGMDTSAYVNTTQQPSQSRAKGGGQRNGEMELVTLGAYGAVETLHEALHEKSDNVGKRYELTRRMLNAGDVNINEREDIPLSTDMLQYLLEAIGVCTDISDLTEEEKKYIKPIDKITSEQRHVFSSQDIMKDVHTNADHLSEVRVADAESLAYSSALDGLIGNGTNGASSKSSFFDDDEDNN